jgi:hypothetical protein
MTVEPFFFRRPSRSSPFARTEKYMRFSFFVMIARVAVIHDLKQGAKEDVDGRHKACHDSETALGLP